MTIKQFKWLHAYNCKHVTADDIRTASEIVAGVVVVAMTILLLLGA